MYENVSPSEPRADSVPLEQIEATVEEAVPSHQIEATVEEEDCRMYENMSTTEQITPTVEQAGQYEQLDIGQDKEEYEDVKIYQRLKVL